MRHFYILCFLFTTCHSVTIYAQNCEEKLQTASFEFERGRFLGVPAILENCLKGGFSNEQKVRAFHLLTQTYVLLGDEKKANESYLSLLQADPEFVPRLEQDPVEIIYISKQFTTLPVFEPHIRLGFSLASPSIIQSINTDPYPTNVDYKITLGGELGAGVSWNVLRQFALTLELNGAYRSVRSSTSGISGDDNLSVSESMVWADVPLYIKYTARSNGNKLTPFAYAGVVANFLISNTAKLKGEDNSPSSTLVSSNDITGPAVNLKGNRRTLNQSVILGVGAKFKIQKNFFFADLRVMAGLNNIVKKRNNFYNPDNGQTLSNEITNYRWVSDYFRLNVVSLSVGMVFPLYHPRKLKRPAKNKLFLKK